MSEISFIVAFSAGLLSFLSPCVLPLVPAYISYLAGSSIQEIQKDKVNIKLVYKAIGFVIGFSLVFILMEVSISLLGRMPFISKQLFQKIGGILIILFGLHTIGVFKIKLFYREKRIIKSNFAEYSFNPVLMGVAFAAGWTPCIGPILSSILIYAGSMDTLSKGIFLLVFYSLGLAVPFILSALAISSLSQYIRKYSRFMPVVSIISGILMLVLGIMIYTNTLNVLSGYLQFTNFY